MAQALSTKRMRSRAGLAHQVRGGAHQFRMRVVRDAQRLAHERAARAAGQVQLDGDGLAAHDAVEAAELVEHGGQRRGDVVIVRGAFGDGHRRGGSVRRGLQQGRRADQGDPFPASHFRFSI